MLIVNIILLLILLIAYFLSLRHSDNTFQDIDKKKHKLYFLYPMAWYLLSKSGQQKKLLNNSDVTKSIRALYISERQYTQTKLYWCQKLSLILAIIFIFSGISLLSSIESLSDSSGSFNGVLIRPEEKDGNTKIRLKFRMENEKDQNDIYEDEIVIENKARAYSDEEWEDVLNKAIPYLEVKMLGDNENAENVYNHLNFINQIPGTGITVEWQPSDYQLISGNGEIKNTDLFKEKVNTSVKAILKYKDKRVEHIIPLTICPRIRENTEILYKNLQDAIEESDKKSDGAKSWSLPSKLGDYKIKWEMPTSSPDTLIFLLGLVAAILIWLLSDKDLQKKMDLRNKQMLMDYPDIINKFNLFLNAGMTIKQTWFKIAEDYKQKIEMGGKTRYAYEEMIITLYELKNGIPEAQAYEQFGQRTGLLPYMKFSSLLVQNLKKGNKDMVEILKREVIEAIHDRKETVKRLGEEASTKLLGPMVIMLFIVLVIIMIPAFLSFKI